jgi:hypothetical protein
MTFFYQSWNHRGSVLPVSSEYWREGIVLYPNAKDREESLKKRAGHAILIVGWDDDKEVAVVDDKGADGQGRRRQPGGREGLLDLQELVGQGQLRRRQPPR